MLLEGRVILVTGAGQGMGRGIAQAALEEGAQVVVTDVRLEDAERSAEVIMDGENLADRKPLPLALDVTDSASIREAMEQAIRVFGGLDGLVNNAGIIHMDSALALSLEDWNRHFAVNTAGLFDCCRIFAQLVTQRSDGSRNASIVNVSSNAGKVGYPNMAAYNASKAAVINLTRSLAAEWAGHNINVNAVCPGGVDTPMLRSVAEWFAARSNDEVDTLLQGMVSRQLGRHIQPIEVGRVVAFLLSDRAAIIRGQSINVDGGDTPY
jgi:meso-butanediol dehydrogenase/(S,S)-butanediol dehydrogenase/diacetyl reductase